MNVILTVFYFVKITVLKVFQMNWKLDICNNPWDDNFPQEDNFSRVCGSTIWQFNQADTLTGWKW